MPRHTVKKIVPVQVPVQQVQSFPAQKEEPKRSVIGDALISKTEIGGYFFVHAEPLPFRCS